MKTKAANILFFLFLIVANASSVLFFYGVFTQSEDYTDLSHRSKYLYMVSPLPLLFDRREYFNSPSIDFYFKNAERISINLDKNYIDHLSGPSHRKLHILRVFAFPAFYDVNSDWGDAIQYFICKPERMDIQIIKDFELSHARINNRYYSSDGDYTDFYTRTFICN